jgi:hypothetical protein
MGTWGCKAAENDSASDFFSALAGSGDPCILLSDAFSQLNDDYIEVDEAQVAIAAAAILTFWLGEDTTHLASYWAERIKAPTNDDAKPLVSDAMEALTLITSDGESSELYELWEESDEFDDWLATVNALIEALREHLK